MTEVRPRGKQSLLSEDTDRAKEWTSSIPDVTETYQCKSYDELSKIINDWLSDDDEAEEDVGTTLSETSASAESNYKSIDEAFADLIDDE